MPIYLKLRDTPSDAEDTACVPVDTTKSELFLKKDDPDTLKKVGKFARTTFDRAFRGDGRDGDVDHLANGLVSRISSRENTALVMLGQPGSGKTSTFHLVLSTVMTRLKDLITYTHELHEDQGSNVGGILSDKPPEQHPKFVEDGEAPEDPLAQFHSSFNRLSPMRNQGRESPASPQLSERPKTAARAKSAAFVEPKLKRPQSSSGVKKGSVIPGTVPFKTLIIGDKSTGLAPVGGATGRTHSMRVQMKRETIKSAQDPLLSATLPTIQKPAADAAPAAAKDELDSSLKSPQKKRSRQPSASPLKRTTGCITMLSKGNGRRGPTQSFHFDGVRSHIKLPVIPHVEKAVTSGLIIDFWIRPDPESEKPGCIFKIKDSKRTAPCLSILINTDINHQQSPGTLLLYVIDLDHKTLEAQVNLNSMETWQHVEWEILSLEDHKVMCRVDGDTAPLKIGTADSPTSFVHWTQSGYIGGEVVDERKGGSGEGTEVQLDMPFLGEIAEVMVWVPGDAEEGARSLVAYWPLDTLSDEKICRDAAGNSLDATAENCTIVETDFPVTAMKFDGYSTHINVGQLGTFGSCLNCFIVELWILTDETKKPMSLLGVLDSTHKHPGFGIEVNSTAFGRLSPCRLCFWVRDCSGQLFACSTETQAVFDGSWHCIRWQVQDAYLGKMKVLIDKVPCDLENASGKQNKIPEFAPFTQWVCLGAANTRGKMEKPFQGQMKAVKLWRGREEELMAHWPLEEGPGSRIAMDKTGFGHNGIMLMGKKKLSYWVASRKLPPVLQQSDPLINAPQIEIVRYKNNKMQMACVAFGGDPDATGTYREVQYDVVHGDFVDGLGTSYRGDTTRLPRELHGEAYAAIKPECFETVKPDSYQKLLADVLERLNEDDLRSCNVVFVFKIGDACFVGVDVVGHYKSKRGATFDPLHLSWIDPMATMGGAGRRKVVMNKAIASLQAGLLEIGAVPQLAKRCTVFSPLQRGKLTAGWAQSDLTKLVLSHLLHSEQHSTMNVVFTLCSNPNVDEFIAVSAINGRLREKSEHWAATMAQKAFRGYTARTKVARLAQHREEMRERERHRNDVRQKHPVATQAKAKKIAVIVAVGKYATAALPENPLAEADGVRMEGLLVQLGYEIYRYTTTESADNAPTKEGVMKVVARTKKQTDALLLVYITGYGVDGTFYRPPTLRTTLLWLGELEAVERKKLESEQGTAWNAVMAVELSNRTDIQDELNAKAEEAARKARKANRRSRSVSPRPTSAAAQPRSPKDRPHSPDPTRNRLGSPDARVRSRSVQSVRGGQGEKGDGGKQAKPPAKEATPQTSPVEEETTSAEADAVKAPSTPPPDDTILDGPDEPQEPCKYILPCDVGTEFTEGTVWKLDDLVREIVEDPQLGRYIVLLVDAKSLGRDSRAQGQSCGGFGLLYASSRQYIRVEYAPSQTGLLSHYFIKGLNGSIAQSTDSQPSRDKVEPKPCAIEDALEYLTTRLSSSPSNPAKWNQLRKVEADKHGEYIGEMELAKKVLTTSQDRKVAKTRGASKKFKVELHLEASEGVSLRDPNLVDLIIATVQALGDCEGVEVRWKEPLPWVVLHFPGAEWNEATKKETTLIEWKEGISKLMRDYKGGVSWTRRFEPEPVNVRLIAKDDTGPPLDTPLDERDRLVAYHEKLVEWIDHVRVQFIDAETIGKGLTLAGYQAGGVSQGLRVIAQVTGISASAKLDRASRLSPDQQQQMLQKGKGYGKLHPALRLVSARGLSEEEEKAHDRWEAEVLAEDRRRAEAVRQQRLQQIAERKREEEKAQREEKLRGAITSLLPELRDPGRLTEKEFRLIFSLQDPAVWAKSLECVLEHVKQGKQGVAAMVEFGAAGVVEWALANYHNDPACANASFGILAAMVQKDLDTLSSSSLLESSATALSHYAPNLANGDERSIAVLRSGLEAITAGIGNTTVVKHLTTGSLNAALTRMIDFLPEEPPVGVLIPLLLCWGAAASNGVATPAAYRLAIRGCSIRDPDKRLREASLLLLHATVQRPPADDHLVKDEDKAVVFDLLKSHPKEVVVQALGAKCLWHMVDISKTTFGGQIGDLQCADHICGALRIITRTDERPEDIPTPTECLAYALRLVSAVRTTPDGLGGEEVRISLRLFGLACKEHLADSTLQQMADNLIAMTENKP